MCTYPQFDHELPHWKYVLLYCAECPYINIPDQETNKKHEDTTPSIRFHIYHIIGCCTANGRIPLKDKKMCYMCKQESSPHESTKIYTRKYLVMMYTTIYFFVSDTTFQPSKSWHFAYHMCSYLVQITVVKFEAQPSKDVNYFNMFYVVVIMLRGLLQAFLIKYN